MQCPNFADLAELTACIEQFIDEWNQIGQPFHWTAASFAKVLAKAEAAIAAAKAVEAATEMEAAA